LTKKGGGAEYFLSLRSAEVSTRGGEKDENKDKAGEKRE